MHGLYAFNALDVNARGDYLWARGEFIAHGGDDTGPYAFYALHDYFVEALFDLEFNTIVSVVPFKAGPRYDRLVSVVDVSMFDNEGKQLGKT
jgi:hypothetical protein